MTNSQKEFAFKEQQHVLDWLRQIGVRVEYDSPANRYKFPSNDLYDLLVGLQSLSFDNALWERKLDEEKIADICAPYSSSADRMYGEHKELARAIIEYLKGGE